MAVVEVSERKRLLKANEAWSYLNVSKTTLYDLIARGELKAVKTGRLIRIQQAELDRWIEEHTV